MLYGNGNAGGKALPQDLGEVPISYFIRMAGIPENHWLLGLPHPCSSLVKGREGEKRQQIIGFHLIAERSFK